MFLFTFNVFVDCEWKAQVGNICVLLFHWSYSGICKLGENIKYVHSKYGEGNGAIWSALGVRDDLQYVLCSTTVHAAMLQDWMRNMEVGIPSLLEDGIKLLVYAGEEDLICNWLGENDSSIIWNKFVLCVPVTHFF